MPTNANLNALEDLYQILSPLNIFTDALAKEKHVSISSLRPFLVYILTDVLEDDDDDSILTAQMKQAMKNDLEARYSENMKKIMDLCCFLDPRFKASFCDDDDETKQFCKEEAIKLLRPPPTAEPPGPGMFLQFAQNTIHLLRTIINTF